MGLKNLVKSKVKNGDGLSFSSKFDYLKEFHDILQDLNNIKLLQGKWNERKWCC